MSCTQTSRRLRSLVLFLFTFAASALALAQKEAHHFDQVSISPDGKRIAWIGPADGPAGDSGERAILGRGLYVRDLDVLNGAPLKINQKDLANADLSGMTWSRDSHMLAFLAGSSGQLQIYVAGADGLGLRKLTNLTGD